MTVLMDDDDGDIQYCRMTVMTGNDSQACRLTDGDDDDVDRSVMVVDVGQVRSFVTLSIVVDLFCRPMMSTDDLDLLMTC